MFDFICVYQAFRIPRKKILSNDSIPPAVLSNESNMLLSEQDVCEDMGDSMPRYNAMTWKKQRGLQLTQFNVPWGFLLCISAPMRAKVVSHMCTRRPAQLACRPGPCHQ